MISIGIDPGLDGAIAIYDGFLLDAHPFPTFEGRKKPGAKTGSREMDWSAVAGVIETRVPQNSEEHPVKAFIEQVASMPKQGVASSFKFGYVAGGVRGMIVAHGIPYEMILPRTWKSAMKLNSNKDNAVKRACELLPAYSSLFHSKKGSHTKAQAIGMAEASLLAVYGYHGKAAP